MSPSPFLEEVAASGLGVEQAPQPARSRVFVHEALSEAPLVSAAATGEAVGWLALRESRSPAGDQKFHGSAGSRQPAAYAVSHVERYVECPFKYFSAYVLKLPEERTDAASLTPQERGQFVHEVFEGFFREWQAAGHRAITAANVATALTLFADVVERRLEGLSETDRALERTHLLGSAAAPGLAERAFAFEIEQGGDIVERLLEHALEGTFVFEGARSGCARRPIASIS